MPNSAAVHRKTPLQLGFHDTGPACANPTEKNAKYETLPLLIDRINSKLSEDPLPGRILSVETVQVKIAPEDWSVRARIDTTRSSWNDEYNSNLVGFVRIFYEKGTIANETIGVQDVLPEIISERGVIHPAKYSAFSTIVRKTAAWIAKNPIYKVTNIQTLHTKHRKKSECGGNRFNTEKLCELKIEERFRTFFLRVGFVVRKDSTPTPYQHPLKPFGRLTFREFLPIKKETGYENITEVMQRVDDLLRKRDIKALHIETIALPEWITASRSNSTEFGDRTFFDGEWYFTPDADGNDRGPYRYTMIYAIRVYLDAPLESTFSKMRSISMSNTGSDCCVML